MAFLRRSRLDLYTQIIYDSEISEGWVRLSTCSDSSDIFNCHPCDGYQIQIICFILSIYLLIDMHYTVFCHVYVYSWAFIAFWNFQINHLIIISEIILLCSLQCIFTFNCLKCYRWDVWCLLNCHVFSLHGEERAACFACLPGVL